MNTVATVGAFLCGVEDYPAVASGISNRYTAAGVEYSLAPPSKSCSIEKLRITVESCCDLSHSATVCNVVKSILRHQLQKGTLKQLALEGLSEFTYESIMIETSKDHLESSSITASPIINYADEYRSLLNTTLVDFVQLPQFEYLELGDSPDTECYPLILAFMTTPTSHEQKLVISLRPDSKPTISDWCEQYPVPTASNIQFKSLVLKCTETSRLVQYLFGFPHLSLRFRHLSMVNFGLEGEAAPSTSANSQSIVLEFNSD